jgi:hypothetical protein
MDVLKSVGVAVAVKHASAESVPLKEGYLEKITSARNRMVMQEKEK